jgi:hypothetical protein
VATLNPDQKKFAMSSVFAHATSLTVARSLGAQWLVFGPREADMAAPGNPIFQSGAVRVYRLT